MTCETAKLSPGPAAGTALPAAAGRLVLTGAVLQTSLIGVLLRLLMLSVLAQRYVREFDHKWLRGGAQAGIAGDRPDQCSARGPRCPAAEGTLLGVAHAGAAAEGDDEHDGSCKHHTHQVSHRDPLSVGFDVHFMHTPALHAGYRRQGQVSAKNRKRPSTGRSCRYCGCSRAQAINHCTMSVRVGTGSGGQTKRSLAEAALSAW